jgi:hypothetical protein
MRRRSKTLRKAETFLNGWMVYLIVSIQEVSRDKSGCIKDAR